MKTQPKKVTGDKCRVTFSRVTRHSSPVTDFVGN